MAEFAGKVRYTGNATGRVALEIKALEHSHLCDAAFVPAVFKDNISVNILPLNRLVAKLNIF